MDTDHRLHRATGEARGPRPARGWCAALAIVAVAATAGCRTGPVDAQDPVGTTGTAASAGGTVVPTGRLRAFSVTAYCTGKVTQSGARVKPGMAAADPRVLPVGSTIRVDGQGKAYDGIYTVTDTGREIQGPRAGPVHRQLPRGGAVRPPVDAGGRDSPAMGSHGHARRPGGAVGASRVHVFRYRLRR